MDDNDPNRMVVCPYDPVHKVAAKRFPYHLSKCRKQYASAGWATCSFNARHTVPVEELDYHLSTCPDRDIIRREIEEVANRGELLQQRMLLQPQPTIPDQPDDTEDWESEATNTHFSITGTDPMDESVDAYDIVQAMQEVQVQAFPAQAQPIDTSSLTAAQKKNLKRSQKRQEKREAEEIGEREEFTEEDRLKAIIKEYGILNKTQGSFVDFISILNQYCQMSRINTPKYTEAPGIDGGFGARILVKGQIFTTSKYCPTKKEARHDAAKCALLGLNVPVVDPTPNKSLAARTQTDRQRLRETHELQLLNQAAQTQPRGRGRSVLTSPSSFTGPPTSTRPSLDNQSSNDGLYAGDISESVNGNAASGSGDDDDEWTTVGRKGVRNPVYQYSLKMAGRGRGMTRR